MANYSYSAKDNKGRVIAGVLEADNTVSAAARLQAMGYFPVSIKPAVGRTVGGKLFSGRPSRRRVRVSDLALFDRQMADLINSGIPLVKALDIVGGQTPNPALRDIVAQISADVSGGSTLAETLRKHTRVFNNLTTAMIQAGEAGGMLEQVLQRLADFSEMEEDVRGRVKSALAYPSVMIVAGIGVMIVLVTVVIPKLVNIFESMRQALPWPTLALMATTHFMTEWWWALLAGFGGGALLLWQFARTEEGGRMLDRILLHTPLVGEVILKSQVGRFSRTLGELLRNGVPILTAMDISIRVITNRIIAADVAKAPEAVTQGSGLSAALKDSPNFPPVVVNMVAIGEETGQLPESLLKIASSYEKQVERSVKALTSLIEPLIILVMGLVVGAIVISMLLPIFSLDPTSGGG